MYIEYSGIYNLTCCIQTLSSSDNICTDIICCLQFEGPSFIIFNIFPVHVMKTVAGHGVVNHVILNVGIIGTV